MTEAELLEAICRRPQDDGPRLIYADWLQERGDPRGEFIQLQCDPVRAAGKHERERELEKQHGRQWAEPFTRRGVRVVVFRRGLPDFLAGAGPVFAEHGAELLQLAPITRVNLFASTAFHSLAPLYAVPEFARVTELSLAEVADGDASARELAQAPHAGGLRHLSLWKTGLTGAGIQALSNSPHLTALEQLHVGGQQLGSDALVTLAQSPRLRLKDLSLYQCELSPTDWRALADCPAFAQLMRLNLGGNRLGEEGAAALSRSSSLTGLEELDLTQQWIMDSGAVALANWPGLRSLRKLLLPKNGIHAEGAEALAHSPHLAGLLHLDLSDNSVGPRGGRALAESSALSSLATLFVSHNGLGLEGVTAFVDGKGLPGLRNLNISPNGIFTGTYTEHSDWDGTVTGSSADEEGTEETKARFASKPHLVAR